MAATGYGASDEAEKSSSTGDDDAAAAYRTWDFLLLAKSRLERLTDSVDQYYPSDDNDQSGATGYDVAPSGYGNSMATDENTSGYGKANDVGQYSECFIMLIIQKLAERSCTGS